MKKQFLLASIIFLGLVTAAQAQFSNGTGGALYHLNNVSINTQEKLGKLTLKGNFTSWTEGTHNTWQATSYEGVDTWRSPFLSHRRATGTYSSPGAVTDGYNLSVYDVWGHTGTGFARGAQIQFQVDGTPDATSGAMPTAIMLRTVNDNGAIGNRLTVKADGEVWIGGAAYNDRHLLSVAGKARAGAFEVSEVSTWMDRVFYDDYPLRPLNEVNTFIELNGHLPDVPSEAEVMENGYSLSEMDANLLRKIEELTLYMIEHEERLESLETENANLKAENEALRSQLDQ
ncbi:MAG: hypothetical protein AAFQ98_18475 [Bacteroidota bacterium]